MNGLRVLVTTWSTKGVAGQLLDPVRRCRRQLMKRAGLSIRVRTVRDVRQAAKIAEQAKPDVALIAPSWREEASDVVEAFATLRAACPDTAVGCLDGFDGPSTPYLEALPVVDRYFKKQLFRDRRLYTREIAGGHPFVAWMWTSGIATDRRWNFGSVADPAATRKLGLSWNIGDGADHRKAIAQPRGSQDDASRDIDVHCRVGLTGGPSRSWYARHRRHALAAVAELDPRIRVVCNPASGDARRISQRRFRAEMRRARIVVSPFGWGEICHRDFEAIAAGAALVKPSMEHLETRPDAYRAGLTYAPVAWDLSDLESTIAGLLDDEERRLAMVAAARDRLRIALGPGAVHRRVRGLLSDLVRARDERCGGG